MKALDGYERTLAILKPDALERGLAFRILSRFEGIGLKLHAIQLRTATAAEAARHYRQHVEKDFYPLLEAYIISGPIIIAVFGGIDAIEKVRVMVGATEPSKALPGTIRGDLAHQALVQNSVNRDAMLYNLIHASATVEEAKDEIGLWFDSGQLQDYALHSDAFHGL